jgi:hypothetical protein|eukprot:1078098-Prymnesium_polylepis.1
MHGAWDLPVHTAVAGAGSPRPRATSTRRARACSSSIRGEMSAIISWKIAADDAVDEIAALDARGDHILSARGAASSESPCSSLGV